MLQRRFSVGLILLLVCALSSCRTRQDSVVSADAVNGSPAPSFFNAGNRNASWERRDRYLGTVQPILAKRCAVCHACSDSPCSLKLSSYAGFARGANQNNFYQIRVRELNHPSEKIGAKDFFAVHSSKFNDSLMFQMLKLGQNNSVDPGRAFSLTANDSLDAQHDKYNFTCPSNLREFENYAAAYPNGGMPYGLPKLEDSEYQAMLQWLAETGGGGPRPEAQSVLIRPTRQDVVHAWEMFLNFDREGIKSQLVARYLYEHLFNAHIVFDEMPGEFFRLVRSSSAPPEGNPNEFRRVDQIETELPTDAVPSNVKRFFYRLEKLTEVVAQKDNTVFRLSRPKIEHYRALFFDSRHPWKVSKLPDYSTPDPFKNFASIPPVIRYRFMLENARYIADSMVRGTVCKGTSATFAIADHFWVFFLKPESDPSSGAPVLMSPEGFEGLDLNVTALTNVGAIEDRFVRNYTYLIEYENALRKNLRGRKGLGLSDLWFGEQLIGGGEEANRNSWLSITRHDTNTTVQFGHEGGMPQSMWVLNYANFERLYYNLVVNFKYWGSIDHKLGTWRSMSHERMDGEDLFLSLLPAETRNAIRMEWSGGLEISSDLAFLAPAISRIIRAKTGIDAVNRPVKRYIELYPLQSMRPGSIRGTEVQFSGSVRADVQLARQIRDRMRAAKVIQTADDLNSDDTNENILPANAYKVRSLGSRGIQTFGEWESALKLVLADRGLKRYAPYVPAITWVRVSDGDGQYRVYSLIGNRGYKSHNISFLSSSETSSPLRDVDRDTISAYRGIVGDYPQIFLDVALNGADGRDAEKLLRLVDSMNSKNYQSVFTEIRRNFAIERNSPQFWPFVDWLHDWMARTPTDFGPGVIYAGLIDLSKYGYF